MGTPHATVPRLGLGSQHGRLLEIIERGQVWQAEHPQCWMDGQNGPCGVTWSKWAS